MAQLWVSGFTTQSFTPSTVKYIYKLKIFRWPHFSIGDVAWSIITPLAPSHNFTPLPPPHQPQFYPSPSPPVTILPLSLPPTSHNFTPPLLNTSPNCFWFELSHSPSLTPVRSPYYIICDCTDSGNSVSPLLFSLADCDERWSEVPEPERPGWNSVSDVRAGRNERSSG